MVNDSSHEIQDNLELIFLVRKEAEKLGRPPNYDEFEHADFAVSRYGSWEKFLHTAGLKPAGLDDTISNEQLVALVQAKAAELGKVPTIKEFSHSSLAIKRYGKWSCFLQVADLKPRKVPITISDKELIDLVLERSAELGKAPARNEFKYGDLAVRRYGSWNTFLLNAGMSPSDETFKRWLGKNLRL